MNGEIIRTDDTVTHHNIPQTDYVVYTLEIPKGEGTYYVEQSSLNNTSAFTVIVYGYEDDETYGSSAGLFLPTDERVLNIEPYFVREVGGEQLALTLPCPKENVAETHRIKCRCTTSTEATEEVTGTPIDLYNIVCITPVIGSTSCNEWSDNRLANFMPDGLSNVPSCPCTDDQAFVDGNFQEDDSSDLNFVHEGAVSCFRSSVTSGSSGQQCCYGSDGNILVGPPAGGTADAYALHIGTIWHFWYDILPWLSCCKQESHLCSFYYEFRPSDDCSQYQPPRPTRGTGDPHFLSLDGKEFTFNGAGEFLLLKSTLHNLTFQARMEALSGTDASVYTAFVLSSNLSPFIQVQRSPLDDSLMILMDMVQIDMSFEGQRC
ncbi:putative sushi domain-containing protein 2 [Apostichopus japonicus]|uniref:Putative sushi domain-containing protein 2 n=1 Tax=Stichopus japonicus TaxID=307972 RepID=A0A2G8LHC3_STIJA|nr:putative sushi domain-containing protein 2 [Apostichopus japonicus]